MKPILISFIHDGIMCSKWKTHPFRTPDRWSAMDLECSYIGDDEQIIVEKHYQKQLREDKLKRLLGCIE